MLWRYSLCNILLIYLIISFILFSVGILFMSNDLVYLVEYELFMFNSTQLLMTVLFDWMSLIFMSFFYLFLLWLFIMESTMW